VPSIFPGAIYLSQIVAIRGTGFAYLVPFSAMPLLYFPDSKPPESGDHVVVPYL